jgi:hypothetical protein
MKIMDDLKKLEIWLKANIEQCFKYEKKAGRNGKYHDAIELTQMQNTYKKVLLKVQQMSE